MLNVSQVSDVSNAVLDGADCVMLSGETAKGAYPVEAVKMMSNICREAESAMYLEGLYRGVRQHIGKHAMSIPQSTCHAAVQCANDSRASAIVALTHTGQSAAMLAQYRPRCPILVVTRDAQTARQAHLFRGCYPVWYSKPKEAGIAFQNDVDARFEFAVEYFKRQGHIQSAATIVGVQGDREGLGHTNMVKMFLAP